MGSNPSVDENKNCIKEIKTSNDLKLFEQYDSNGDIIYYYKQLENSYSYQLYIVYDVDKNQIGSIKEEMKGVDHFEYTICNENNQITNFIEKRIKQCNGVMSTLTSYIFYDINRNVERIVTVNSRCCNIDYEELDNYRARLNLANLNQNRCDNTYWEYDNDSTLKFKVKIFFEEPLLIKIFDNNDNEVNLDNKSLFNDGFSKIQFIIILRILFAIDMGDDAGPAGD